MKDLYKTITKASEETLFKDRNSKFFGYAFPVFNEDDVKASLEVLKKKHHTARHFCYAYQLGLEQIKFRANIFNIKMYVGPDGKTELDLKPTVGSANILYYGKIESL